MADLTAPSGSLTRDVTCEICGRVWDGRDPGVRYHPGSGIWTCTGEAECFLRRAEGETAPGAVSCGTKSPGYTWSCQRPAGHEPPHMAGIIREW